MCHGFFDTGVVEPELCGAVLIAGVVESELCGAVLIAGVVGDSGLVSLGDAASR